MPPTTEKLLTVLRATFRERIAPMLPERGTRDLVDGFDAGLSEVLRRIEDNDNAVPARSCAEMNRLIDEGARLLCRPNPMDDLAGSKRDWVYWQARLTHCRQTIVDLVGPISELARNAQGPDHVNALRWLDEVVQQQHVQAQCENRPIEFQSGLPPVTRDLFALERSIAQHIRKSPAVSIAEINILSGGLSRETLEVIFLCDNHPERLKLVLRRQVRGVMDGYGLDITDEFGLMCLVHEARLSIPEPYWLEQDDMIVGGPFIAMPFVTGKTVAGPERRVEHVRALARVLASVHRVAWHAAPRALDAFGLRSSDDLSVTACLERYLERLEKVRSRVNLRPCPIVAMALAWLHRHTLRDTTTAVLQHGDCGLHKLLFVPGEAAVLLGWESAFPLHPAKDLAHYRAQIGDDDLWGEIYRTYLSAGGFEVDASHLAYFSVLQAVEEALVADIALESGFGDQLCPAVETLVLSELLRKSSSTGFMQHAQPVWRSP